MSYYLLIKSLSDKFLRGLKNLLLFKWFKLCPDRNLQPAQDYHLTDYQCWANNGPEPTVTLFSTDMVNQSASKIENYLIFIIQNYLIIEDTC